MDFQRIEELFLRAVELPAEDLEPWLKSLETSEDPLVLAELKPMLHADRSAEGRLASAIEDAAAELSDSTSVRGMLPKDNVAATDQPGPGYRLGAYELVRELGRGGMSTVFLAVRSDQEFEQTVAVKVVRHGLADSELSKRLLAERQILARLAHPNIARLLDGGTTESGMPFFVMEVIDGEPIDQYCDRLRLSITERLQLFQKVCGAVHYAHRNLVVHRDLKPSNVLVTDSEEDRGEPKLLDFGIAKLLDPTSPLDATVSAYRMGTPGYISPEQVRGQPITTAADVYSLGVLLYRLLTGERPYVVQDSASIRDMETAILEQQPRPPSVVARELSSSTAMRRGERPEPLSRRLRGDLDNIVLKSLRKEPERRYASVDHLARDLDNHLLGRPVSARPDTFLYRSAKFVRRHRWAVAGVAVLIAVTVVFLAALVRQQEHTARQRDHAEQVAAMLVSLFGQAGPTADLSARDLLDLGQEELQRLEKQPETQAMLRHTLGELYDELGLYGEAEQLFETAYQQRRRDLGASHTDTLQSLYSWARSKALGGDHDGAEPLFRRALDLRRQKLGNDHPDVVVSLNSLALVLHEKGDYSAAIPLYRQALDQSLRINGSGHGQTVKTRGNLALLLLDQGLYEQSESMFREALRADEDTNGQSSQDMRAEVFDGLAQALLAQGKTAEAESISRQALELRRLHSGDEHVVVARSLAHVADVVRRRDPKAAQEGAEKALEMRRRVLGDNNAETGESHAILAAIHRQQGRIPEALDHYRQAVKAYAVGLSPQHPMAARPVAELGTFLADEGRCSEALPLLERALEALPAKDHRTEPARQAHQTCAPSG